jgi:hypothetical protein
VVESLADITVLIISVTAITGLLLLRHQGNGDITTLAVIASASAGLVAAHLTDAVLPAPRFDPAVDRGLPAVVVGIAVGAALGLLILRRLIDFTGGRGAFAGSAVAAVACLISIGASFAGADSTLFKRTPRAQAEPMAGRPASGAPVVDGTAGSVAPDAELTDDLRLGVDSSVVVDEFAETPDGRPDRSVRALRPIAAVLVTLALTVPAGYVLINALAN